MSEAPEKKKRSPVERLIVWGLIGVMLVVVLIEYRAVSNFKAAYKILSDIDHLNAPTLDELKDQISGETVSEKQTDSMGTSEVELSFFSLFKAKQYKLRVQLADIPRDGTPEQIAALSAGGGVVTGFYQPDILAAERNRKIEPADPSLDTSSDDIAAGMAGGGMGAIGGGDADHDDGSGGPGNGAPPPLGVGGVGGPGGGGPGGGGRPGGGGGRRGGRGMAAIAANPEVQTKLNITEEQVASIKEVAEANQLDFRGLRELEPPERMAAITEYRTKISSGIKGVLDAEQFETIQRMTWAQEGPMALAQQEVAVKIGLTEDQVAQLAKIREGMDFRNPPVEEMLAVLNDEQKTKWSALIEGMEPPAPPENERRPARPAIEE